MNQFSLAAPAPGSILSYSTKDYCISRCRFIDRDDYYIKEIMITWVAFAALAVLASLYNCGRQMLGSHFIEPRSLSIVNRCNLIIGAIVILALDCHTICNRFG